MALHQILHPMEDPVTLEQAKQHLRVDHDADDALITSLITAATQAAQTLTGRQFVTARWQLRCDGFTNTGCRCPDAVHALVVPKAPLQTIVALEYLNASGEWRIMSPTDYVVDKGEPTRVLPIWGKTWPLCLPQIDSVIVTFDAGYGTAAQVPEGIKSWIKLRVGSLYAHREEMAVLSRGRIDPLPFVDGLLDPYKVVLA